MLWFSVVGCGLVCVGWFELGCNVSLGFDFDLVFGGFEFVDLIMWLGSLVVVFTGSLLFGCSVAGWLRDGCGGLCGVLGVCWV